MRSGRQRCRPIHVRRTVTVPVSAAAEAIARTKAFIRERFAGEGSGHDWWHVDRVRRMALRLAPDERADVTVVELAALLHDVADHKFTGGDHEAGPRAAAEWLAGLGVDGETIRRVAEVIAEVSFRGAGVETPAGTPESRVVQDADRLDAIGAIGIARAFAYGGSRGRALHDPTVPPEAHDDFERYKASTGPTTNHFHEKLLLIRDRLHTPAARRIAEDRHAFMEVFLAHFQAEWDGRDGAGG
jgi:uncharacterized protein